MPKAVDRLPSMPAKPRLANTSTPVLGAAKASKSLIGREDATYKDEPFGRFSAIH